jgi:hypothetical protein
MSVRVIDEVTCDDCGQVVSYERMRISEAERLARIEPLPEWLQKHGWALSNGLRLGHFCQQCSKGA